MATRKLISKQTADKEVYCYIGPTIRGVIQEGALFMGESRSDTLKLAQRAVDKYPLIQSMILPADAELTQARIRIKTPGTALYKLSQRLTSGK